MPALGEFVVIYTELSLPCWYLSCVNGGGGVSQNVTVSCDIYEITHTVKERIQFSTQTHECGVTANNK